VCENLGHARKRDKTINFLRQSLLGAHDEIARHRETLNEASQDLPLQRGLEIGEGDIATKDEIEGTVWRFATQILMQKADAIPVPRPHAEKLADPIETLNDERFWQFAETASRIAAFARTFEHNLINVRCNNGAANTRESARHSQIPKNLECVWLFA